MKVSDGKCDYQKHICPVVVPEEIDIFKYCLLQYDGPVLAHSKQENKRLYKLKTMICHVGADVGQRTRNRGNSKNKDTVPIQTSSGRHLGHYYMGTKDIGDQWKLCDDVGVRTYDSTEDFTAGNYKMTEDLYLLLYC